MMMMVMMMMDVTMAMALLSSKRDPAREIPAGWST